MQSSGKTVGEIAKDLDLTETALREWVRKAEQTAGGVRPTDATPIETITQRGDSAVS